MSSQTKSQTKAPQLSFKLSGQDLSRALKRLQAATLSRKQLSTTSEHLSGVLIQSDHAAQTVTFSATNGSAYLAIDQPAQVIGDSGEVCVHHRTLLDWSRLAGDDQLDVSWNAKKDRLVVKGDRKQSSYVHFEGFPTRDQPEIVDNCLECDASLFLEAFEQCTVCTGTSQSRIELTGVLLRYDGRLLQMVGSDGVRLCEYSLSEAKVLGEVDEFSVLVPSEHLRVLKSQLKPDTRLRFATFFQRPKDASPVRLDLSSQDWRMGLGLLGGKFPAWEDLFPDEIVQQSIFERQEFLNILTRLTLTDELWFRLASSGDELTLVSQGELATHTEVYPRSYRDGPEVAFQTPLFRSVIASWPEDAKVRLGVSGSKTPALLDAPNYPAFRCIVMPAHLADRRSFDPTREEETA